VKGSTAVLNSAFSWWTKGRLLDVQNQAVLVSLLLMDDIKDERKDQYGNEPVWRLEGRKWQEKAKKMLRRANLMGYYVNSCRN